MEKPASNNYPLTPLVQHRWSPRAFEDRDVEPLKICSILEAARWAPSCYNEQPWRFFVGSRDQAPEALKALQSVLVEGNAWAKKAPVLMLSVAKSDFSFNGKFNRHAQHDVGLAVQNMVLQAEALGLATHQMAGFDDEKAREILNIPEGYVPMAMIAIGYPGAPEQLEGELRERETSPRERQPLQDMVFSGTWQQSYPVCFT